jgi:hypothetical protein
MTQPMVVRKAIATLLAVSFLLCISGCVAPYDATSDQAISTIHKQFDAHVDAVLAQPATTTIVPDTAFYNSLRSDIRSLKLRTEARGDDPSLKPQAAILDELLLQVDTAEKLEQQNLHGKEAWQTVKHGLSTNFKGFLTSELARKKAE